MIGLFDSGSGGLQVLRALRGHIRREGILFLADRDNAPYGTKSPERLAELAESNIARLVKMGARRVLIACCTACTVFDSLSSEAKRLSVPIIEPTAHAALSETRSGKIAVIATEATVRSHAFGSAMPGAEVLELAAQRLVGEVEGGASDGNISFELKVYLRELLLPVHDFDADTLVLGCTHFPALKGEIERTLREITKKKIITVSSAHAAAEKMCSVITDELDEGGLTVYL